MPFPSGLITMLCLKTKKNVIEEKMRVMNELLMLMVKPPSKHSRMREEEQNKTIVHFMRLMASIRERMLAADLDLYSAEEEEIASLEVRAKAFLLNAQGVAVVTVSCIVEAKTCCSSVQLQKEAHQ
jgi:hypothetical protein